MSLHKGNHVKQTKWVGELGETPAMDLRGVTREALALRQNPRLRSPFGFAGKPKSKLPGA